MSLLLLTCNFLNFNSLLLLLKIACIKSYLFKYFLIFIQAFSSMIPEEYIPKYQLTADYLIAESRS